jgi:proline dehydrogenase
MLRSTFLWLSERRGLFEFVKRNGLARQFSSRFVAGETLDEAIATARELNTREITVSLDLLGESVTSPDAAAGAREAAIEILDRIHATGVCANLSIKLTQMGLDLDPGLAADNASRILDRAREHRIFVRVDMEASAYVQRTLELYQRELRPAYGDLVGVVVQTMLRRTEADIDTLLDAGARVRLVKGAYKEPESVAFPDPRDVDAVFARCSARMLAHHAREGACPRQGHRTGALRIPDALWRAARPAGWPPAGGVQRPRVCPLRDRVVPVPDAADG